MIKWIEKVWKDPVWSCVISTLIISLGGIVINTFTHGKVLKALMNGWDGLISFFTYKIPVYWILITIVLLIGFYLIVQYICFKKNENVLPSYYAYTEDTFNGIPYRWEYCYNQICNLRPLCPNCKTPIVDYNCPRCRYDIYGKITQSEEEIKTLIADNIRRRYNQ